MRHWISRERRTINGYEGTGSGVQALLRRAGGWAIPEPVSTKRALSTVVRYAWERCSGVESTNERSAERLSGSSALLE